MHLTSWPRHSMICNLATDSETSDVLPSGYVILNRRKSVDCFVSYPESADLLTWGN